ncbi:hypothetical protein SMD22_00535 (plasmid) [Brevibacillus halotolerans]|nr:hypothetical protein SMD22_00535 [Brevibacillus halotolerans]
MFNLTNHEINEAAIQIAEEFERKEEQRLEFTKTMQDTSIDLLVQQIKKHRFLDSDSLDETDSHGIKSQEFHFLFDNVMDVAEELGKDTKEMDNDFQNKLCFLKCKDVRLIFFIMWGQGTCTQVYVNDDDWQEEKSFTYEQMKEVQTKMNEEQRL